MDLQYCSFFFIYSSNISLPENSYSSKRLISGVWYLIILNLLLLLVSITLPIIFKYGYNKSYIAINLITGITLVIVIFYSMQPIGIMRSSDGGAKLLYNSLKLFLTTGVCIVIYLASMYISTKIYTKKEIAN